jgi:hypothetical protein
MRVGFNPNKDKELLKSDFFHQVVIPVYIPHQEEYFKDSFQVLKICLESLFKTAHDKTYITIVNNGSCNEVMCYLNELFFEKRIHELVNSSNIGYINAMLKGISGQNFPFFTTADADVLFLNNWQKESYKLFKVFSKTGAVSPSPNSRVLRYFTGNVLFEKGFSNSVKFTNNKDPEAMIAFAKSVGNEKLFNKTNLEKCLTIGNSEARGLIGAGHFIVTYRSDVFDKLEKRFTKYVLGGDSDFIFDKPVEKKGFWRLSTEKNYAFHMGNVREEWMIEVLQNLHENRENIVAPKLKPFKVNRFVIWFKTEIFSRVLFKKPIWRLFLQYKGLSKSEAKKY